MGVGPQNLPYSDELHQEKFDSIVIRPNLRGSFFINTFLSKINIKFLEFTCDIYSEVYGGL